MALPHTSAVIMEAWDNVIEGLPCNRIKERLMVVRHSSLEIPERFSLSDLSRIYQLASQLHDDWIFVRIYALANVIFDFQRPVLLQKQR
jgi:hypothetical protein